MAIKAVDNSSITFTCLHSVNFHGRKLHYQVMPSQILWYRNSSYNWQNLIRLISMNFIILVTTIYEVIQIISCWESGEVHMLVGLLTDKNLVGLKLYSLPYCKWFHCIQLYMYVRDCSANNIILHSVSGITM